MSVPSYSFYFLPLKLPNKGMNFPLPPLKLPNKEMNFPLPPLKLPNKEREEYFKTGYYCVLSEYHKCVLPPLT